MALLYHTKDDSTPYGKPRVFFTCHPSDWEACFLPICEDLFQFCSCAVYYNDPASPSPQDAEYNAQLARMNLIVIPVTAAFLTQPSPALEYDFRFAMEHRIPVLPLVQEPGLDKLFALKCGNLQYLDKTVRSATAIPYEEKLEQFLKSVLLNDDIVHKIRSHFDGHIFLSYRKKDRRHVRDLMGLIHSFPQFRDIGLWYDEYLTPGEDFNDEIAQNLKDSQLFAMIVTPNLVNEDNYVKDQEYPMAKKRHKPVLPIQFESTDADVLRSGYPEIPDCLDPADTAGVESSLNHALSALIRRCNDTDPIHCYHIGLAYLTGTDVEVDHALALKLITQAAESGLEEAMEKLIHMYRFGNGVTPDPEQVVHWVHRLVDLTRSRHQTSGTAEDAYLYYLQLSMAGSSCVMIDRFDLADAYISQQIDIAKILPDLGKHGHTPLIHAYEQRANLYDLQGYKNESAEWLCKAYELRRTLIKNPELSSVKQLRELIRNVQGLGDIYKELMDPPKAEQCYRQAIAYLEMIRKNTVDIPHRIQLAELYQSLGGIYELRAHYDEAEKQYLIALEMAKAIAANTGDDSILIGHYQSLGQLGDLQSRLTSGRKYWKQALKIAQQRDDRKRTDQTQTDLAGCHLQLGISYYTNWTLRLRNVIRSKALPHLEQSLAIFRELDQKQNTYLSKLYVHSVLASLSELHINMDFFREAEPYCLEQLAISEQLLEQLNNPETTIRTACDYAVLSKVCKALKKNVTAARYARRRFDLLDAIAEEVNTCEIWNDLAEASFDWALLTGNGKKLRYAIEIWQTLDREHPDIPIYAQRAQEAREYLPKS